MLNALYAAALIVAAFIVAFAVLLAFGMIDRRRVSRLRGLSADEQETPVFLFDNETLLDATAAAHRLLETAGRQGTSWSQLSALLAPRYPDLQQCIRDLSNLGELSLISEDGLGVLKAEWHDGVARISLHVREPEDTPTTLDRHGLLALNTELETLRENVDHTPYPLWRESSTGAITWCNSAYLDLADSMDASADAPSWPPKPVFDTSSAIKSPGDDAVPAQRVPISIPGQSTRHWFEITEIALENGDKFLSAIPANALVRTETSLQEFVTTLTKTFASLPIGLAIFDRSRRLAIFNPALIDLTVLPADFLISKPSFSAFLDRLREARMIPEPKDYRSWRQQLADLEAAAQNGTYEKTWTLPTGQTYRVTGRPHPDGAVALLFEDISAEMSVTRRFRAEIDAGQAVIDALPQGIAVFTQSGVLSMANTAYTEVWGNDPSTSLTDVTFSDALRRWRDHAAPTPAWEELYAFAANPGQRTTWTAQVAMLNGQTLSVQAVPLAGGASLVSFSVARGETIHPALEPGFNAPSLPMVKAEA